MSFYRPCVAIKRILATLFDFIVHVSLVEWNNKVIFKYPLAALPHKAEQ
jgi:hypothetical protein